MSDMLANAVHMYSKFCDDTGLDRSANLEGNTKIAIMIMQKNIDIPECFQNIFPDNPFVDWERIDTICSQKFYKNTHAWMVITSAIEFQGDDKAFKSQLLRHAIFKHYMTCLNSARLELPHAKAVQLFLLLNISNLSALNTMEVFFSTHANKSVTSESYVFFSALADQPFDKSDRTQCLISILQSCAVDCAAMKAEIEMQLVSASKLQGTFKQRHIQACVLRPKLRSKLRMDEQQHSAMATLDAFRPWCDAIRFPNVFSLVHKKKLYFAMAQHTIEHMAYLDKFVNEPDLRQSISQYTVKNPDIDILTEVIESSRLTHEPFSELHGFREKCFTSFSQQQKNQLKLQDLFHLYMAAYQSPSVWKTVWTNIYPVLSIQIIKDVESFVLEKPINHQEVMNIIFSSSFK